MKKYYVYIVTNKYRTTLYVGVCSDLNNRISQHNDHIGSVFTSKYNLTDLIYFEDFNDINQAISREKQIKNWKKEWKLNLIKSVNSKIKTIDLM